MPKIKYEKPELVELNEKNVVQGACRVGSIAQGPCNSGISAPAGSCTNGVTVKPSRTCITGGTVA